MSDYHDDARRLDREMASLVAPSFAFLRGMRRHALASEGKKRRGRLLIAVGVLLAAPRRELLTAAAAAEIVHLASLIHDDILDGGMRRRRTRSMHRVLGTVPALLYGDLLFTRGVSAITRIGSGRMTGLLLETVYSLCAGEILEAVEMGKFPWKKETYYAIAARKTAALFQFCCLAPGILAGLGAGRMKVLGRFGRNLGLAYQIADDCLDFTPPGAAAGKDRLADLRNGAPNLPLLLAGGDRGARAAVRRALAPGRSEAAVSRAGELVRAGGFVCAAARRAEARISLARTDLARILKWGDARAGRPLCDCVEEQAGAVRRCARW